jgi:hypothetical protein
MYPAIEITLRLDRIRAAQRRVPAAVGPRFGPSTDGTNLLPFDEGSRLERALIIPGLSPGLNGSSRPQDRYGSWGRLLPYQLSC